MPTETLEGFLDRLSAGLPTPGGGAAAAVQTGLGAALVGMAARCTPAGRFPEVAADVTEIARGADECRRWSLEAAAEDESAFAQVAAAYRLPKDDDAQRRERARSVNDAMEAATEPPLRVLELAERLVDLAERLVPIVNPQALADLATGVEAARSAAAASRLTVETNLRGIDDDEALSRLRGRMGDVDQTIERAHRLTGAVWGRLVT